MKFNSPSLYRCTKEVSEMEISTPVKVKSKLSAWIYTTGGEVGEYVSFFNWGEPLPVLLMLVQFVHCKFSGITF